jgi:hypothetical protein
MLKKGILRTRFSNLWREQSLNLSAESLAEVLSKTTR